MVGLVPINVSEPEVSFGSGQQVCSLWVSPLQPPGDPCDCLNYLKFPFLSQLRSHLSRLFKGLSMALSRAIHLNGHVIGTFFSYLLRKLHGSPRETTESLKIKSKIF